MFFKTVRDLLNETSPERRGEARREGEEGEGEERRRGEEEWRQAESSKGKHLEGLSDGTCLYIAQAHYILHSTCINSLTH